MGRFDHASLARKMLYNRPTDISRKEYDVAPSLTESLKDAACNAGVDLVGIPHADHPAPAGNHLARGE